MASIQQHLSSLFVENKAFWGDTDTSILSSLRAQGMEKLSLLLPQMKKKDSFMKKLQSEEILSRNLVFQGDSTEAQIFHCEVDNLDTYQLFLQNGHIQNTISNSPATNMQGLVVCSFAQALQTHAAIMETYLGRLSEHTNKTNQEYVDANPSAPMGDNQNLQIDAARVAMNDAFLQDGIFIYLPKGLHLDKPLQLIHLCNAPGKSLLQGRCLLVMEDHTDLTLIQCTDSNQTADAWVNALTEIYLGDYAHLEYHSMQNLNNVCSLYNTLYLLQNKASKADIFSVSLNGGKIANYQEAWLKGEGAIANLLGLYLMDKSQEVENIVKVNHEAPNCQSQQLFKGILDDSAKGFFNGHVKVEKAAQKTEAFQNNKNLLLTAKAKFITQPFLEIYADDVKCSHGATVGQLDEEALFYMRARGISQAQARRLLMYAFTDEIIRRVSIDALRTQLQILIKKRLSGQLSACEQCVLHCGEGESICASELD
ncbi:MAG: Fe-S cluster assembly protein SufD [Bacteroidales bacterium]